MPFILCQIDFMPVFSREHNFFYFMPISLCPPINGIKSEFMPDRHKNGRPTLSRFDMKSDRYCVEPVCVCFFFVPRDQFDMRACREWSTNAALEVVSHAMCSRTTLQGARANARPTSLHTTVVYVSRALNNLWVWIIQRDLRSVHARAQQLVFCGCYL